MEVNLIDVVGIVDSSETWDKVISECLPEELTELEQDAYQFCQQAILFLGYLRALQSSESVSHQEAMQGANQYWHKCRTAIESLLKQPQGKPILLSKRSHQNRAIASAFEIKAA